MAKKTIDESKVTTAEKLLAMDNPPEAPVDVPVQDEDTKDAPPIDPFLELLDQVRFFVGHLAPNERGLAMSLCQQLQEMYDQK